TNGTAASPERPINFITGLTFSIIQGNIGVYWRMVTINVIGKITFPNIQTVFKPCCRPRYAVPDNPLPPPLFYVYFFFFSFTFFTLYCFLFIFFLYLFLICSVLLYFFIILMI